MIVWKISLLTQILLLTCCSISATKKSWTCNVEGQLSGQSLLIPHSFSVHVESKIMNNKTINLLYEVYFQNVTRLTVTNLTHVTHCLYDYNYGQIITLVKDINGKRIGSCLVNPLQQLSPCVPGHLETIPLFQIAHLLNWTVTDMANVRFMNSTRFERCANYFDHEIKLHAYIDDLWHVPEIDLVKNNMRIKIEEADGFIINDYVDYDTNPTYENIQLPLGMFCGNMKSRNMTLPDIPNVFSMHYEKVFLEEITTEKMIFDKEKKYVIYEKENQNVSHGADIVIYDYYTGHKYTIVKATGQCQSVEKILYGDKFVKHSSSKLEMTDALSFFRLEKSSIEYVGLHQVRGVMCNVWTGLHFDEDSQENVTIDWYFTQKNWTDNISETSERFVIFRMDIWRPGSPEAMVYNIYQFDTAPPSWSTFDITPCISYADKIHFTIQFKVNNNNKNILKQLTDHSSKQQIQVTLSKQSQITPVRLANTEMDLDMNKRELYFTASLLEAPREENEQFKKDLKNKNEAFLMIQGLTRNHWNYSIQVKTGMKENMIEVNLTAEKIWKSSADRTFLLTTKETESPTTLPTTKDNTKSSIFTTAFQNRSTIKFSTTSPISSTKLPTTRSSVPSIKHSTSNTPKVSSISTMSVHTMSTSSVKPSKSTIKTALSSKISSTKSPTTRSSVPSIKHSTSNTPKVSSISTTPVHTMSKRSLKTSKSTFKTTQFSKTSTNKHTHSMATTPKPPRKSSSTIKLTSTRVSTIRPMMCSCPTLPTQTPCTGMSQSSKETISQGTLIGSLFGSFFFGIIVALILFKLKSIFWKKYSPLNANFDMEGNPYDRLE